MITTNYSDHLQLHTLLYHSHRLRTASMHCECMHQPPATVFSWVAHCGQTAEPPSGANLEQHFLTVFLTLKAQCHSSLVTSMSYMTPYKFGCIVLYYNQPKPTWAHHDIDSLVEGCPTETCHRRDSVAATRKCSYRESDHQQNTILSVGLSHRGDLFQQLSQSARHCPAMAAYSNASLSRPFTKTVLLHS